MNEYNYICWANRVQICMYTNYWFTVFFFVNLVLHLFWLASTIAFLCFLHQEYATLAPLLYHFSSLHNPSSYILLIILIFRVLHIVISWIFHAICTDHFHHLQLFFPKLCFGLTRVSIKDSNLKTRKFRRLSREHYQRKWLCINWLG